MSTGREHEEGSVDNRSQTGRLLMPELIPEGLAVRQNAADVNQQVGLFADVGKESGIGEPFSMPTGVVRADAG